jgi:hypothetical protein
MGKSNGEGTGTNYEVRRGHTGRVGPSGPQAPKRGHTERTQLWEIFPLLYFSKVDMELLVTSGRFDKTCLYQYPFCIGATEWLDTYTIDSANVYVAYKFKRKYYQ